MLTTCWCLASINITTQLFYTQHQGGINGSTSNYCWALKFLTTSVDTRRSLACWLSYKINMHQEKKLHCSCLLISHNTLLVNLDATLIVSLFGKTTANKCPLSLAGKLKLTCNFSWTFETKLLVGQLQISSITAHRFTQFGLFPLTAM